MQIIHTRKQAAELLLQEKVIAVPTETVYGLAGLASSPKAVNKIFTIKQRPKTRPLIVHYGNEPLWLRDCIWHEDAALLAEAFWPGPLTMILERSVGAKLCSEVSGSYHTVAIRRTAHKNMAWLCDTCGPLAAPSANGYQQLSTTTIEDVQKALPTVLSFKNDVTCAGVESTIIDLTSKPYYVRRLGGVSLIDIRAIVECLSLIHI